MCISISIYFAFVDLMNLQIISRFKEKDMFLKTFICLCLYITFLTGGMTTIEDVAMTGRTSWNRAILTIVYCLLLIIALYIPAEKYCPPQDSEDPEKEMEVEVFSIQPKIENGDTTYIIKYRTK